MIHGLTLVKPGVNVPFIQRRYVTYAISLLIIAATLLCFLTKGLNYGIDFKGGIMIEAQTFEPANIAELRSKLAELNLGETTLQEYGSPRDILIRIEHQEGGIEAQNAAINRVKNSLDTGMEIRRIETVGPKIGAELVQNGLQAVLWGLLAILVYIWFRFEWQFGLCAILALAHDAIAVLGLYAIFGIEFNTTAIVAILTTIGYSINDTVVIFDRIRENLRRFKKKPIPDILNLSVNETLSRTILTSGSTLVALGALYFFGGEVIASYSLPILVGVIVGTYSSVCLAAPLLLLFNLRHYVEEETAENRA